MELAHVRYGSTFKSVPSLCSLFDIARSHPWCWLRAWSIFPRTWMPYQIQFMAGAKPPETPWDPWSMRSVWSIHPTLLFCMLRLQALRIAGLQPWEPYCVARAHAMAVSCQHSLNILGHTILSPLFFTLVICTTLHLRAWHWKVLRHQNNNPCPLFHCHFQRRDHVDKYGFDGIRVDAARHINRTLQCYHAVTWRDVTCVLLFCTPAGISWIISLKPGHQFQPTMRLDVRWWDMSDTCWTGKMTSTRYVKGFVSPTN